jgi:hypothetical protein
MTTILGDYIHKEKFMELRNIIHASIEFPKGIRQPGWKAAEKRLSLISDRRLVDKLENVGIINGHSFNETRAYAERTLRIVKAMWDGLRISDDNIYYSALNINGEYTHILVVLGLSDSTAFDALETFIVTGMAKAAGFYVGRRGCWPSRKRVMQWVQI